MPAQIDQDKILSDLIDSAIEAKAHYQVWWALAHHARPRFVKGMNRFPDFIIATQRAHYDSMIIHLAHLFDKHPTASSIYRYLCLSQETIPNEDVKLLEKQLEPYTQVIKSVIIIRNNTVAHKNVGMTEHQVFKLAGITPDQVSNLINSVVSVIEALRRAKGWVNGIFDSDRYSRATLGVLAALEIN